MSATRRRLRRPAALALAAALAAAALPGTALGAPKVSSGDSAKAARGGLPGSLAQLAGEHGCLMGSGKGGRAAKAGCTPARALAGPGPFMGSRAIAVSADGRNVYVASSKSDAIAIFARDPRGGALTQPSGAGGCLAAKGAEGCAKAIGLDGPNSVALSPNGRFLYATSRAASSVTAFRRDPKTGALTQLPPGLGCVAGTPIPGCAAGRALVGPDVVAISPDGENLYAGSFFGNAIASFKREPSGALVQLPEAAGCIAEAIAGCASAIALGAPEGLAVSPDGASVYAAAALSNAVAELARDPASGALSQQVGADGCVADAPLGGCAVGVQLAGANAVAIAPAGRDVYVTSLFSDSVASFGRSAAGILTPKPGTHACLVWLRAVGCSFGRALSAPEGLALSPKGANAYVAAFASGAIDVLGRERESGVVFQLPGKSGCVAPRSLPGCTPGRALKGVSSIAVSPDGRNVYSTAFGSNAVDVFQEEQMSEQDERRDGVTRKQLLGTGASAAAAALLTQGLGVEGALAAAKGGRRDVAGMNVILFLTDQERAIQHFPSNWLRQNMPGMRRLRRHGISFERAFTNACMCSPARSTLMSGYFPAQHGVKYTLEEDMPYPEYPAQAELPPPSALPNLATVMKAAGYNVVYKGKWHCSKPAEKEHAVPADLEKYGFLRWNPPDAGANQTVPEAGGGYVDNDGRFVDSVGEVAAGSEGVLQYLGSAAAQQQPFFLVISLVNPHDVLFYPSRTFEEAGYDRSWLEGEIEVPGTNGEDLSTKPSAQAEFLRIFNLTGKPKSKAEKRAYLNFYGNLMRSSDSYLVNVLDKLEETGLLDDTLIVRTADHGEMGLTHGGLRQKNFNFYEEAIRVPLVYSNPKLYPRPLISDALVSHVDFLPTLASLAGAPKEARRDWQGVDYSSLVRDPAPGKSVQDYVVFTYDDYQSGQNSGPYPKPPNHIVSIREGRWKLAKYYDVEGNEPPQWEMYDLKADPEEKRNIADPGYERSAEQERQLIRLKRKLAKVDKTRLRPL